MKKTLTAVSFGLSIATLALSIAVVVFETMDFIATLRE